MEFSFFKDGIKNTSVERNITLANLVELVKHNPQKELIGAVRMLRSGGYQEYKEFKRKLDYVTPGCKLKMRKLKGTEENLISLSGLVYVDIDIKNVDIDEYKESFINRYKGIVSFVAKSSSLGGLCTLFRIDGGVSNEFEYQRAWDFIKEEILQGVPVDDPSRVLSQPMFVTFDPDVYFDDDASVTIPKDYLRVQSNLTLGVVGLKELSETPTNLNYEVSSTATTFNYVSSNTSNQSILKTKVHVDKPIVDIIPIKDFTEIRLNGVIEDDMKHKVYTSLVHKYVHLNPTHSLNQVIGFVSMINDNYAKPPMIKNRLVDVISFVYKSIKETKEYSFAGGRLKQIHFSESCGLSGQEKREYANKLNAALRKNNTIRRILTAKQELMLNGEKVTQRAVIQKGISRSSVKRYWNESVEVDILPLLQQINSYQPDPVVASVLSQWKRNRGD